MTTQHITRTLPNLPVTLTWLTTDTAAVVGAPADVATAVASARHTGQLVAVSDPRPIPGGIRVTMRLAPAQHLAQAGQTRRPRTGLTAAAITAAAFGILAGLWLLVQAINWVLAHAAQIGGVLAVAAVILVALSRSSVCRGVVAHCRGCRD
jgi:hypothetical protein